MRIVVVFAVSEHHHFIGNNLNAGVLCAFLVVPAAGLQASFNVDLLTLGEILLAYLGEVTPGNNIEPFRFAVPFSVC